MPNQKIAMPEPLPPKEHEAALKLQEAKLENLKRGSEAKNSSDDLPQTYSVSAADAS